MKSDIDIKKYSEELDEIERIIQYKFKNRNLLLKAFTHPSAARGNSVEKSYERLEFLGDSILGACVAIAISDTYKDLDEGHMTRMKVAMVSGENLTKVAKQLNFDKYIIFGKSEESTGKRGMKNALEDVYEATVAAVFYDGGPIACWRFINSTLLSESLDNKKLCNYESPKSILQQISQTRHVTPEYVLIKETGPAHDKTFYVNVMIGDKVAGTGCGHSKKEAETEAARDALNKASCCATEEDRCI